MQLGMLGKEGRTKFSALTLPIPIHPLPPGGHFQSHTPPTSFKFATNQPGAPPPNHGCGLASDEMTVMIFFRCGSTATDRVGYYYHLLGSHADRRHNHREIPYARTPHLKPQTLTLGEFICQCIYSKILAPVDNIINKQPNGKVKMRSRAET